MRQQLPPEWAGLGKEEGEGERAAGMKKANWAESEEGMERKEEIFFLFPNKFSKLIFKLNLNSIQILVKANHYKNKCAATCFYSLYLILISQKLLISYI